MRRNPGMVTAAAVLAAVFTAGAAAAGTGAPAAAASGPRATWGTALKIPGLNALNRGGQAGVTSVSCPDSADCAAGGSYESGPRPGGSVLQAFVASMTHGVWSKAEEVPGTAVLNANGNARVTSVSCAAAGDCLAGGWYTPAGGHRQPFVTSEIGGTWATAEQIPGVTGLNRGTPGATVTSVSCAAPGDCLAGGRYGDGAGRSQAFVASETGGIWGKAEEIPGTAALNTGGYAIVNSVSCASAGNCSAGGRYASNSTDGVPVAQAFVVSETNGTWGQARKVPGTGTLNTGGYAEVDSVSCASAGNCSAGGAYTTRTPATEAFVVSETNGTWGTAQEVPGTAALNTEGLAQISSVSCAAPGSCGAGGFYLGAFFHTQAFVVSETNGTWGTAREVQGTATLDKGSPGAKVASVSCAAAGVCSAGGFYSDPANHEQAFVVNETHGTWGKAEEIPGTAALNTGGQAGADSVSCAPRGLCTAGGTYTNVSNKTYVFAVSETGG
jgi:hypothetical protein